LPLFDAIGDATVDETGMDEGMLVDDPCEIGGKMTGVLAADGRP